MPYALIKYVRKEDFFPLLEAQQFEHFLADLITGSQTPTGVSNRYFSQVLMTQRLQRALLEVELYAYAISMDGLVLLEGKLMLCYFAGVTLTKAMQISRGLYPKPMKS